MIIGIKAEIHGDGKMRNNEKTDKKYTIWILVLSIAILLTGLAMLLTVPDPVILLNGSPSVSVDVFSEYRDEGAQARFLFFDLSDNIETENDVDPAVTGNYQVRYRVRFLISTAEAVRTVTVVDRVPPVVTLVGDPLIRVEDISEFVDPWVTAADNYDGDLTSAVVLSHTATDFTEGERAGETEYVFTYSVQDSGGNPAFATRTVIARDVTPPVITLNGGDSYVIVKGQPYVEPGATAEDNISGAVEVSVSGGVDTSVVGSYAVKYTAEDAAGNVASVTRTVTVRAPLPALPQGTPLTAGGSYVALTFDDGPSDNTTAVLDVLKQYKIKATFFILNYDDNYVPVLRRMVNEGHTLAIHSWSHDYSAIYTSPDAYMQGVYKLYDKIYDDTGYHAVIIRFPGGSSNTVSKKYCTGVMSALAKRATAEGFCYYDWNVDSGDANGNCMGKDYIVSNVAAGLRQGRVNVVLMHDSAPKTTTPQALPAIIADAQKNGYTFIPLSGAVTPVRHGISN